MTEPNLWIYCHKCGDSKNHSVLAKKEIRSHPDEHYDWGENHYLAQCLGCNAITYAAESYTEDDWDPETSTLNSSWKTYPKGAGERSAFDGESELPPKVRLIYNEVVSAINAQLPVLTGIGLRTLIEAICKDRDIKGKNLEERIDGLATAGVLATSQAAFLHGHRFLGNAAAHEVTAAQPEEISAALDIAENLLRTIYVLPALAARLKTGRKSKVPGAD